MSQQIQITAATGTPPYDVYICDQTLTYCALISGGTTIPPTVVYDLTGFYDGLNPIVIKIVDSLGCEYFKVINCPTSPTPTPTLTPTPTPTPLNLCNCIQFNNPSSSGLTFNLTQCDGSYLTGIINPYTTLYYCGRNPNADINVIINTFSPCVDNTCV